MPSILGAPLTTNNIVTRISYLIFALISYLIYLASMIIFAFRLLGIDQFLKEITVEFQLGLIGSIFVNITLIVIFGVPHSVMARAGFKKFCSRIVPLPIERSFYVFIVSITLTILSCLWQPIYFEIWNIKTDIGRYTIYSVFLIGFILAVVSTFLIDHFELFGLKQAWNFFIRKEKHTIEFATPSLYKLVRHPMMFGILLVLWSTPFMDLSHLILSIGMTLYIIIGTFFEEKDLVRTFGERYLQYKQVVPMLLPFITLKKKLRKINTGEKYEN
ncbi:isoprenylcysteine carboxylmethyltransferase family protein [Leptospira koniambonensis]|uniref:Isoprenylcysteine carboxylmethyltransferase family protein n=1 Tax=Leptospira koniambonensis TaxID=2484950 RepID=A0A4R9J429_9LEPT|nr:NnrU family protein [Leptospira koniambonensis]TGL31364.1 isoprenylcysteine carboxylmethyltransferase family protein [Leptospira koniambonensis]